MKLCEHIEGLILHVLVQTACRHRHPFGRCNYFSNGTDVDAFLPPCCRRTTGRIHALGNRRVYYCKSATECEWAECVFTHQFAACRLAILNVHKLL
jgi:hypothetical protein